MSVDKSELGKATHYDQVYDPGLLFPISRADSRRNLSGKAAFLGEDWWTCYELSWLNPGGLPASGIAHFRVPCESPNIIESKSFKLYLNSLNFKTFESTEALRTVLETDLGKVAGAKVSVSIETAHEARFDIADIQDWPLLEEIEFDQTIAFSYEPDASLLSLKGTKPLFVEQRWCSHLLRSNCPVTNQPDWGSVFIEYRGSEIEPESLLRYLVSFRQCQGFHEHCVEKIFSDLSHYCECSSLSVYARYTRRGGLDINPYRVSADLSPIAPAFRTARQ